MATTITLIRHGETAWNREHRSHGRSDIPLNENGLLQARLLAEHLREVDFNAVYTSPLSRAAQTAGAICDDRDLEPIARDNLLEMDFGEFEGLYYSEMLQKAPDLLQKWAGDPVSVRLPGAELLSEVFERAVSFASHVTEEHPGGHVCLVSHNFVVASILCHALGLPLGSFRRFKIDNASRSVVSFNSAGSMVLLLNDSSAWRGRIEKIRDNWREH